MICLVNIPERRVMISTMKTPNVSRLLTLILWLAAFLVFSTAGVAHAEMVMLSPTADSYVDNENAASSYGQDIFLISRFNSKTDRRTQPFLKFDLSLIPPGSTINEATLKLYLNDMSGKKSIKAEAFRATGDWDEQTLSWNNKPTGPEIGKTATVSDNRGNKNFDLTSLVAGWLAGSYPNFGLFLDYSGKDTYSVVFNSREAPNNQPYLVIYYAPPASSTGAPSSGLSMAEGKPPSIIAVNVTNIGKDTVTISWMTDVKSDSKVRFGKTAAYDYMVRANKDTTSHSIVLRGLSPGTSYHYRVFSVSAADLESSSADLQFKTAGQPVADTVLPSTPFGWLRLFAIAVTLVTLFLLSIVAAVEFRRWFDSRRQA